MFDQNQFSVVVLSLSICLIVAVKIEFAQAQDLLKKPAAKTETKQSFELSRAQLVALQSLSQGRIEVSYSWDWKGKNPWEWAAPKFSNDDWEHSLPLYGVDGDSWWTTDQHLESLREFPSIRYVHLAYCCRITDKGIAHLAKLPQLRTLVLYRNKATFAGNLLPFSLSKEQRESLPQLLTDKAIEHISKMPALEALYLDDNEFSERAILELGRVKTLRLLRLDETQISDEGLKRLKAMLPNCDFK